MEQINDQAFVIIKDSDFDLNESFGTNLLFFNMGTVLELLLSKSILHATIYDIKYDIWLQTRLVHACSIQTCSKIFELLTIQ